MKRKVFTSLLICICFLLSGCQKKVEKTSVTDTSGGNFLFLGLDAAAQNTDEILLLSVQPGTKTITLLQIPRDTYFRDDNGEGKLNSLFARAKAKGKDASEALSYTEKVIGELFGVPITLSMAITFSGVTETVDLLDGVNVNFPADIKIGDKNYEKGEHLLSGEEALAFVRYRQGYTMGDLSRLDAQKAFYHGLFSKIKTISPMKILSLIQTLRGNLFLSLKKEDVISLYLSMNQTLKNAEVRYLTAPGEGLYQNGISYFVLNKKGMQTVLQDFVGNGEFDQNLNFVNPSSTSMNNIYYDENPDISVFTDMTVDEIIIQSKN